MWDTIPRQVLVGVETADCLPALQAAAQEAVRRSCGVHLLHVMPPIYVSHPRIEELELVAGELHRAGVTVLGDAARTLETLMPEDLLVSTELCHGTVASSLVEVSAHACVLVLHQHDGHRHRLSTIQPVVARAQCPVLVVRATWGSGDSADVPWVVAGVEDASSSAPVVQAALAEASRRHARLRLVHGVDDQAERFDGMDAAAQASWSRREQRRLEADICELCGSRPDVAVEVEVSSLTPAAAVVAQSRGAELTVMGRGHGRVPFIRRPGPVTAEVLSHVTCPVLVVDEEPADQVPRLRGLTDVAVPSS